MKIRCKGCGRLYIISARQAAKAMQSGYLCEECEAAQIAEQEREKPKYEFLRWRAEAYHVKRALRRGGAKLDKRRTRREP